MIYLSSGIQPLSSYIQPLYQRWSQPDVTQETILEEFKEMIEKDFNEIDPDRCKNVNYSYKTYNRFNQYESQWYRHKDIDNELMVQILKVTHIQNMRNTSTRDIPYPEEIYEYRLYHSDINIQHHDYGITDHETIGEYLVTPVPHWAEKITVAKNNLVMLRPMDDVEAAGFNRIFQYPVLKLKKE